MITSKVIIALDFSERQQSIGFSSTFRPSNCGLKVGKSCYSYGPKIVRELQSLGFEVFLDLKNFMIFLILSIKAIRATAGLDVWMVNVHASGGRAMLRLRHGKRLKIVKINH